MLIFKNNIYEEKDIHRAKIYPSLGEFDKFEPISLVRQSIEEEFDLIAFIKRLPKDYWEEEIKKFFPVSYKIGGIKIIEKILRILKDGLDDSTNWYHMNTYHFCVLYDSLHRQFKTYNEDAPAERLKSFPDLKGNTIHFDWFFKCYFFNTVFLLHEEKYNSLGDEQKKELGFTCPHQFGVINGLTPVPEEIVLKEAKDYPYIINV